MMLPDPVVVLGGGGFVGSHLVRALVAAGQQVTAVDQKWDGEPEVWSRAAADLTNWTEAQWAVDGAASVLHFAADMGGVGYFHSDADLGAAMRNGRMTLNVIEACRAAGVERLVYASSACAYPVEWGNAMGLNGTSMSEDVIGAGTPDAMYGAEKLHGMRLTEAAGGRTVVLDTVYGPGSAYEGPRAKFPASVAYKALQARQTGKLELWGDGSQVRRFLWVDDAVARILAVAGADHYDGPVNITGSRSVTCREVAELCLSIVGADAEITTNPAEPTGVAARMISGAKYDRLYNGGTHSPEVGYELGFRALIDWLRGR